MKASRLSVAMAYRVVIVLSLFCLIAFLGYGVYTEGLFALPSAGARVMSTGMLAPDFVLTAQDGRTFQLSNYKGRPVYLAFVPTWTDTKTQEEVKALAASQRSTAPGFEERRTGVADRATLTQGDTKAFGCAIVRREASH